MPRLGLALIAAGFTLFFVGPIAVVVLGGTALALLPALVGFALMGVGGFVMASQEPSRAPPGTAAPPAVVRLSCPSCGGAPSGELRAGVTTCEYCGTRFAVR